jgi:hypothetical protein
MGHTSKSCSGLWAIVGHTVLNYGKQHGIWYNTIAHFGPKFRIRTMGHRAKSCSALYKPQYRIWSCTIDHSAESGSALWAANKSLIPHYGPECEMVLCNRSLRRICFRTMRHSAKSASVLWATAQKLVPHGPQRWIWFHDLGHISEPGSALSGSTLEATVHKLIPRCGP